MLGAAGIGAENAQASDQYRQFRRGQREQLRAVDQELLGLEHLLAAGVVAEPVGGRLEGLEGFDVGFILRRVHPARREGNLHIHSGVLRSLLDRRAAAENDEVGKRNLLASRAAKR